MGGADDATPGGGPHAAGDGDEQSVDDGADADGVGGDEGRLRDQASAAPASTPGTTERPPHASGQRGAADEPEPGTAVQEPSVPLDVYERTVLGLLTAERDDMGAPHLEVDADLVRSARERACTMASGATPLLAEDDTENIGLVVEIEPDPAATAMHDWWMQSAETRSIRLADGFTRYGVGACPADDRVYYSERFGA
ncbi:MAG TPA: CAP domain-containing protein [Euzebyales bacterium]|nr:CAP domain-containing protein [Euzebyales bacterium]